MKQFEKALHLPLNGKGVGSEELPIEIFKALNDKEFRFVLLQATSTIFCEGEVPVSLKEVIVVMIEKEGLKPRGQLSRDQSHDPYLQVARNRFR